MKTLPALRHRGPVVLAVTLCLAAMARGQSVPDSGWPAYGNDPGGTRYSPARQIDRSNVTRLQVAWTCRTGDMQQPVKTPEKAAFEATPILVEGKLVLSTADDPVSALA